jgi:hypothetical protein
LHQSDREAQQLLAAWGAADMVLLWHVITAASTSQYSLKAVLILVVVPRWYRLVMPA